MDPLPGSSAVRGGHDDQPCVALLPWGILEDFLDPLGVSFEQLCREFTGSFVFGYAQALQQAGVHPLLIYISCRVSAPVRCTHEPTGASICILPAPLLLRTIRSRIRSPHAHTVATMFGPVLGWRRLLYPILALLRETLLYFATPIRPLARELREARCRAILCQEYEYPRFDVCTWLGRILGLPVFATFQGGDYQRSRLERLSRPLAMRMCAGLIIASDAEAARVRARYGVAPDRMASIFNPVDIDIWSPVDRQMARTRLGIPASARVLVWHGRVSIQSKGLDILLAAWKRVCAHSSGRDLRLVLIGTGRDAATLRNAIAEQGITGILWVEEFLQDRMTVREYLSAGDVYVFPSRHEGFPVAPIEAMACGLPVVAADARGIREILEGGEHAGGIIVPREDPEALTIALRRLIEYQRLSRTMGTCARHRVEEHFTLAVVGRQLRGFLVANEPAQSFVVPKAAGLACPEGRQ